MRILLACDRSKGHSYPALVLARYIKEHRRHYSVVFYGLKKQDRHSLEREGFRCFGLDIGRRSIVIEGVFLFFEALTLLLIIRPKRVLGFGGRNSFFIVLISSLFVPVFLFEPNATFGRANKVLSFVSRKVFLGLKEPRRSKEVSVGVPLRGEITGVKLNREEALLELRLKPDIKTILVFGGSAGSSFINELFCDAAVLLKEEGNFFQVIHVTGSKDREKLQARYGQADIGACVFDFYEKMGLLYKACDAIVSRGGASTLAEICFFSRPALLIPYPYAYGHQSSNARFLQERKAALMEEEFSLNNRRLRDIVRGLLEASEQTLLLSGNAEKQKIWSESEDFSKKVLSYI